MGSVSVPPSKAVGWGGEVGLGGCSLSESTSWFEEEVEVTAWGATWVVLLLLKTCPSADSSSYSEGTTTTLLPLPRGAGSTAVSAKARGMAAMGGGELGGWFGEGRAGEGVVVGGFWGGRLGEVAAVSEVGRMESPTPLDEASPLDFKAWASFHLLCLSIFESAPRRQTWQELGTS